MIDLFLQERTVRRSFMVNSSGLVHGLANASIVCLAQSILHNWGVE